MPVNTPILVDSGPLVAAFIPEDAYHLKSVEFFESNDKPLITCDFVITEVSYFIAKFSKKEYASKRQERFLDLMSESEFITRFHVTNDDLLGAKEIMSKYSDLPADLTDAILVNHAMKNGTYDVISIDKDFSVYRGASKTPFNNLFISGK